jgi:hypothetical protein
MNDSDNYNDPNDYFENEPNQDVATLPNQSDDSKPSAGAAFAKGGCGCLLAFLVLGVFVLMIGGSVHVDILGALFLFIVGGIIGLIFLAVYNKGRRDG